VIRDFRERTATGGHPDFELTPAGGFAAYQQECQDTLDSDGKPVFRSAGKKVNSDWKDASGRAMMQPRSYINALPGDVAGSISSSDGGALTSASRFAQWYRDVPGVNVSMPLNLTLVRQAGTNTYTFNDRTDPHYSNLGGFFPINGELFGNSGGTTPNQNFHFTFELSTNFRYQRGTGQVFNFTGDDDVFVFVDGKLVIDLGGIHAATNQSINLDRLNWLVDGQDYQLKFFSAERHRTQSNVRIDTNMMLRTIQVPQVTHMYD
jgi:fibro-slime domain-containing protein